MELDIPGHPRKLPQSSRLTHLSQLASSEDRRCLQHKINKQNIFALKMRMQLIKINSALFLYSYFLDTSFLAAN